MTGLEMLKWWRTDRQTNRISAWRLGGVTIDLASNCYNMLHNMFSHYGKVARFPILATCQGKWLTMPMQIFIFHIFPTVGEKLDIWEEVWGKVIFSFISTTDCSLFQNMHKMSAPHLIALMRMMIIRTINGIWQIHSACRLRPFNAFLRNSRIIPCGSFCSSNPGMRTMMIYNLNLVTFKCTSLVTFKCTSLCWFLWKLLWDHSQTCSMLIINVCRRW